MQGNITILAMTIWSLPSSGGARETTLDSMEGGRGNRGKTRLSSERGISRRYRAKPYVPQNPSALLQHLTQLSWLLHSDRKATCHPIRTSILEIISALQVGFRKKRARFCDPFSQTFHSFSSSNHTGFTQSRNSRKVSLSPWIYATTRDRKSVTRDKPIN